MSPPKLLWRLDVIDVMYPRWVFGCELFGLRVSHKARWEGIDSACVSILHGFRIRTCWIGWIVTKLVLAFSVDVE